MKNKIEEVTQLLLDNKLTKEDADKTLLELYSAGNQKELLTKFINEIKEVAPYFIQYKPNELVDVFINRSRVETLVSETLEENKIETLISNIREENLALLDTDERQEYDLQKLYDWQEDYSSIKWEDFKNKWFYCDRCKGYDEGQCLC